MNELKQAVVGSPKTSVAGGVALAIALLQGLGIEADPQTMGELATYLVEMFGSQKGVLVVFLLLFGWSQFMAGDHNRKDPDVAQLRESIRLLGEKYSRLANSVDEIRGRKGAKRATQ